MPDDPDLKIVETRDFITRCDVAITQFGHRWRFRDAFAAFSTQTYASVDEAFEAARSYAATCSVPLKPK